MIDFPASPTVGQTFSAAGVTWTWDGAKWLPSGLAPTVIGGINDNRIINGDMRIDQRNNGASGNAINVYTADHWHYGAAQAAKGNWGQVTPGIAGFPYYLGFTSSSAYASTASDYFFFMQPVEAGMVSDFAWGAAGASPVTLSFWAFSSLAGTHSGAIRNYVAPARSYPFTYTLASSAWTKVVITIPGDTTGTWPVSGNGGGLYVRFNLGTGSTYLGPANAWGNGDYFGATGSVSVVGTNGGTFALTGVKLEIGSVATPFNRQSLAKSQADCERYFRWIVGNLYFTATGAGQQMFAPVTFSAMRAAPTISGFVADPNTSPAVANISSSGHSAITAYGANQYIVATGSGGVQITGYRASASAEL